MFHTKRSIATKTTGSQQNQSSELLQQQQLINWNPREEEKCIIAYKYAPIESHRAGTFAYKYFWEEEEEKKSEKKVRSPKMPWLLLRPIIQIPRASGSEGNHQNRMQSVANKITQRSRTRRSPPPNTRRSHKTTNAPRRTTPCSQKP